MVTDEGHSLPGRHSLLFNISLITHNLGCRGTEDRAGVPPAFPPLVAGGCRATCDKLFLSLSSSQTPKERRATVTFGETLPEGCIIEELPRVVGKGKRWKKTPFARSCGDATKRTITDEADLSVMRASG